ncbi:thioredoxin [Dialister pneumosintes]|uniref:Thioredoxin n=1 Tax=Dialister pneumosintes TaxID=39950 RepID=A0ABX9MAI7_9FIRM|nr:thioredoxin [Dialister pneumosintes]RID94690.1 thioredoxin [Dialister pneumosintes]
MEIILTKDNFETEVLKSKKPVLVDFWATWCPPCRLLGPVIAEIAEEQITSLKVGKVDVDEQKELASQFNIMSIPTMILFKDGKVVKEILGYKPKEEILELINL